MKPKLLASLLILCPFQWVSPQFPQRGYYTVNLYVERENQPDGGIFLPAPPDTCDIGFYDDFVQWSSVNVLMYSLGKARLPEKKKEEHRRILRWNRRLAGV